MSTTGVVGQPVGTPVQFSILQAIFQIGNVFSMSVAANAGVLVKRTGSAPSGSLELSASGDTVVEGVLTDSVFDPSAVPTAVANRIWGVGQIELTQIGNPATVYKWGRFFVTAVNGVVADGDFLEPFTNGFWQSSSTTNN